MEWHQGCHLKPGGLHRCHFSFVLMHRQTVQRHQQIFTGQQNSISVHCYCVLLSRNSATIVSEFVTSVFKIRRKKFVQIRIITSLVTANSSNSHNSTTVENSNLCSRLHWGMLNGNSGQLRTIILTVRKTVKLQAIRRLCNRAAIYVIFEFYNF